MITIFFTRDTLIFLSPVDVQRIAMEWELNAVCVQSKSASNKFVFLAAHICFIELVFNNMRKNK